MNFTPITQTFIALGANLPHGDMVPAVTLRAALRRLSAHDVVPVRLSPFLRTPAFPAGSGPDYINAAAALRLPDGMGAQELLALLHRIEAEFGRERHTRWAGRTLDLDLIAMGDLVLPDAKTHADWRDLPAEAQARQAPDQLILPHPRLADRAFVLAPLALIAPEWRHPVSGLTTARMLAALPAADRAQITAV